MDGDVRVVIIGAGAVGLALGSCLHRSGHGVRYLVRDPERGHPIAEKGILRTGIFGDVRVAPASISLLRGASALRDGENDFVLVCTKTTASRDVAGELEVLWRDLRSPPAVVLCQNGWGNAEIFAERIPSEHVYNARIITGFHCAASHHVDVTVHADAIHMGSLFGADAQRLAPLARAISSGGIPCEITDSIEKDLWAKVLYNSLLNPLGALVGVRYGVLGERESTREIMETAAREIFAVLRESAHETHWTNADDYLDVFYRQLLPPTALHESSMLQDLRAGKTTEIDALCGAVVQLGERHGVDAPVNRALTQLVHLAEQRAPRVGAL